MPRANRQPGDYIRPINMNGLDGRMLRLPPARPKRNREILLVYGHHALLERWWGLAEAISEYGSVTMPDLPGFGGMQSLYRLGQAPSIDRLADYLAAFIRLRYKRRRITIVGVSFGFVVVTRMLQNYPDIADKVDILVSLVGFMHVDDFVFTPGRLRFYRLISRVFSWRLSAATFRYVALNPTVLRLTYSRTHNARHKFAEVAAEPKQFANMMDMEIELWHKNDVRTHMRTTNEFLHLDNCAKRVQLPVWHVYTAHDNYFDNHIVEQHLRVVYDDVHALEVKLKTHAPSILADKKASAKMIPPQLRRVLRG